MDFVLHQKVTDLERRVKELENENRKWREYAKAQEEWATQVDRRLDQLEARNN